MATEFSNKVAILAELYVGYKNDNNMKDFIEYNDLGLPLAFLAVEGLAEITEVGFDYIEETWILFLAALEIEDKGFEQLEDMFKLAQ
jgi:hypothetical protein